MTNAMVTEGKQPGNLKSFRNGIEALSSLSTNLSPFIKRLNNGDAVNVDVTLKGIGSKKLILILGLLTVILFVAFIICFIGWLSCKKISNFKFTSKNKTVIFFHHDGCGHCTNFKQIWIDSKKTIGGYTFIDADTSKSEYNNILNTLSDKQLHQSTGSPRGVPTIIKINRIVDVKDLLTVDVKDISVYTDYPRTKVSFDKWLKK